MQNKFFKILLIGACLFNGSNDDVTAKASSAYPENCKCPKSSFSGTSIVAVNSQAGLWCGIIKNSMKGTPGMVPAFSQKSPTGCTCSKGSIKISNYTASCS